MFYYEIIVNAASYQGKEVLTYGSSQRLAVGSIVHVALKSALVLGVVSGQAPKPPFTTKTVEKVFDIPPLPSELIELGLWLSNYYPTGMGLIGQQLLPKSLPNPVSLPDISKTHIPLTHSAAPPLTSEQQAVMDHIKRPDTYLLHGETGTGKTRVYTEIALRTLNSGRSAIILTPEIALTPQLARNFEMIFGDRVIVTHSKLTTAERRKAWLRILMSTHPLLVIGPRSALFSPLKSIGLIVLDESHEPSYKQEQSPHYLSGKVAAKLSSLHNATLILGSATPSVVDYYVATQKQKPILRMQQLARPNAYRPSSIHVIDLRKREHFTQKPHLSNELITAIDTSLRAGEQSLLFLNRRGTARVILCEHCGWQAMCSHCNIPLVYHGDGHFMQCHTCGLKYPGANSCPVCHSPKIILKSVGTKAIVDEVTTVFPHARIQRFDTDNRKSERIEQQYESIRHGDTDIIIGTQILAKGLDLPKLSVVGVVIADTGLQFPDYTADERTYQLLRQVIGRVGRGHRESTVIVQTYDPSNFVIQSAMGGSWDAFYQRELALREKFLFPPFCHLLKLTCRRASNTAARQKAEGLAEAINAKGLRVRIDGPSPPLHEKVDNKYQWQLILKSKQRGELLKVIEMLPSGWSFDIDPTNLL